MIEGFKFGLPESLIPDRLPIGIEEVVKKAPKQRFTDFYRKWYVPGRMVVIVTGDVAVDDAKKAIVEHFTSLKAPVAGAADPDMGKVTTGTGLQAKLHTEKEAGQVSIAVAVSRPSPKRPDNTETRRLSMIRQLANAMLNRRFEILAKKPDSPFLAARAGYEDWLHFVESNSLELTAKPENWDKALAAGEQELRRAVMHGFTKSELSQATANLLTSAENAAAAAPTIRPMFWCG
jgi:zinc protease